MKGNIDSRTVEGFGREWATYDQGGLGAEELQLWFDRYFEVFPWDSLPVGAQGFDMGCGSGRWATRVAPQVGVLHCIDASAEALSVARRNLASHANCEFHHASVDAIPLPDASMDFAYSLGVLHHVPDTAAGIRACVAKLKPGAPFLVYLYYAFDNRPAAFRLLWRVSDLVRRGISRLPFGPRRVVTQAIATLVYWPLARLAGLAERAGADVRGWPLSAYRHASFYTMRTDALDRFGTLLEQRFTRARIEAMLVEAGLCDIRFRDGVPYWCAVGVRVRDE